MAAIKLLHLLALSTLAILASSFGSTQVTALATNSHHVVRHNVARGHDAIAKRKRSNTKRCKKRPSSSSSQAPPTSSKAPVLIAPTALTKDQPKPSSTSAKQSSSSSAPAKQSSSPAAAPSPVSQNGNTGIGKVGIAWPNGDQSSLANFKTDKVGPLYTWSPFLPTNAAKLGFNAIPMLWGENQVADFQKLVVKGYANTVLGFNEPNETGQSNMTPQRGAQLWQQYIQPLKSFGYKLISPATSSAPSGKKWMQQFFAACTGCTFDGIAIHYYDVSAQGFIDYIEDFHTTFNLDVWPTEFACQNFNAGAQCSASEVTEWMETITKFMDNTPWVAHYFAFGVMLDMQNVNPDNQLMASNGEPTALGKLYLNAD